MGSANLQRLIGSTFIDRITDNDHPALKIGTDQWTTRQLGKQIGVTNTKAARLLTLAAATMSPPAKNVRDFYNRTTPYLLAGLHGLGVTTMYVLWEVFAAVGLDPDEWSESGPTDSALVSFITLKKREQAGEKRTLDAAQKRHRNVSRRTLATANDRK